MGFNFNPFRRFTKDVAPTPAAEAPASPPPFEGLPKAPEENLPGNPTEGSVLLPKPQMNGPEAPQAPPTPEGGTKIA